MNSDAAAQPSNTDGQQDVLGPSTQCIEVPLPVTDAATTVIKKEIDEPLDYSVAAATLNEVQDSSESCEPNYSGKTVRVVKCRPFVCMLCCRSFAQRSNLKVHLRCHTGEKPFRCDQCDKTFPHSVSLKYHLSTHTGKKPYECQQCDRKFIRSTSLKRHIRTHTGEKPYKCEVCNKCFTEAGNLNRHKQIHTDEPMDVSVEEKQEQDASFLASIPKEQPEVFVSLPGDELFKCAWCDKIFMDASRLKKHAYYHTREKPYSCELCNKSFISPIKLSNHVHLIHSTEKIHDCDQCEKKFANRRSLKYHRMTHRMRFSCEFCNKTFSRSVRWKQHCSLCRADSLHQPASSFEALGKSVRRAAEKLIYSCELCSRKFTCLRSLEWHRSMHVVSENCFKCMLCEKSFSKLGKLRSHLKIHNVEKPYQCNQCEKSFLSASKLKRHEACHSGDKRYQCLNCEKRFTDSTHLKRHAKTHSCETESNFVLPSSTGDLDDLDRCDDIFLVDSIGPDQLLPCLTDGF